MKIDILDSRAININNVRLDASYHLSDGPATMRLFHNCPYKTLHLDKVCERIFKGNIFKRTYVDSSEFGYPFLTGSDIMKSDLDNVRFISKKFTKSNNKYFVEENWILITRSGTLGNLAFSNKMFDGMVVTDDLIRVVPNNKTVKDGFLYAYLSSKYGKGLLTQGSYGGVIKHIEPHHLVNIPVPVFPKSLQDEINDLIHDSKRLRIKAFDRLNKATSYFDNKYNIENHLAKTFVKDVNEFNFSWVVSNNDQEAESILNRIHSNNFQTIRSLSAQVFSPPMFKHIYLTQDNGYPFLKGGELRKNLRNRKNFLSTKGVGDIKDYQVHKNSVLVYKSGPRNGMLGKVFIVDESIDGFCLSDHVIRIAIEDEKINYWVFSFLKSKVGLKLLQNLGTGSAILFITPERLSNLPIPPFDRKDLDRNFTLVKEFVDCFAEAHSSELRAISLIEKEIESWQ